MLRQIIMAAFCACGFAASAVAAPADEPKAVIQSMYDQMIKTTTFTLPDNIYSPRIQKLFADDKADGIKGGGVGRLDWDAWVNGQDFEIKSAVVSSRKDEFRNDREIVQVHMINFGKPATVYFYFEHVKGHWQIDDIRWPGPDGWTLSLVLKYGSDFVPAPDKKYPY
ncbi:MAG TPA: hypothetical protein VH000_10495 [Rhizomicrobium sp.]|jgi:ABC-type transporter MlaC component|nr:hypothetical protein [Rhizomicrobium sp.]